MLPARIVHQDLTHETGGYSEKMRPILPAGARLINEAQISFVDQRCGLQRVALAFSPQAAGGQLTEFPVHQWRQVIQGLLVTLCPLSQQSRHFVGSGHRADIDNTELRSSCIVYRFTHL
jgi:hypothetical protein